MGAADSICKAVHRRTRKARAICPQSSSILDGRWTRWIWTLSETTFLLQTWGEKFAHELLGHVWGEYFGGHSAVRDTSANGRDAVNAENEVRRTDPSRGQKTEHHHD